MSKDHEAKKIYNLVQGITTIVFSCYFYTYLDFNGLFSLSGNRILSFISDISIYILENYFEYSLFYFACLAATMLYFPSFKLSASFNPGQKSIILLITVIVSIVLSLGFSPFSVYNIVVYPILLFGHIILMAYSGSFLHKSNSLKNDSEVLGINTADEIPISLSLAVVEAYKDNINKFKNHPERLIIPSPHQGVWIEGGAGSGKSASIMYPFIDELVSKGSPGYVYDYEGDPTEKGDNPEDAPPILTRYVYSALLKYNKIKTSTTLIKNPLSFGFINFTDMSRTNRVNIVAPRYFSRPQNVLESMDLFAKALNVEWVRKKDFWADNGIAIIQGMQMYLYRNHPDKCTIPHTISFLLSDYSAVFRMLSTDDYTSKMMRPVIVAFEAKAHGQLAGAVASAQFPPRKLFDPYIYWVLSGDDFDLRISSKSNPSVLCVGNSPNNRNILSAPISLLTSVVMRNLNTAGNLPSFFMVDELPTLTLDADELSHFPNTVRKKGGRTILACQSRSQLIDTYGKEKTTKIIGSMGSQFYGMQNDDESAKHIAESFGRVKRVSTSFTESTDSSSSNRSKSFEDVFQARDIKSLPKGTFVGKVANGNPALFKAKFKYYTPDHYKLVNEIPPFSIPTVINSNEFSPAELHVLNLKVLEGLVQQNFINIQNECAEILAPFMADVNFEND